MKVIWSPRAISHLAALRRFIAKDPDNAAALVAERIVNAVERLRLQPESGRPGRIMGTRELVIPGTQYIIPYRVKRNALELLGVFHGRQTWPNLL